MFSSRQSMESLELFRSPLGQSMDRISVSSAEKRNGWASKLEEIEIKLGETELINSDLHQIRAELNRKIIELEKAQKPLVDENRRLQGRNRNLQQEIKKKEQQLSHAKDDFFTMRDAHERLRKENSTLKGKKTNAENLEQLDRYRQQILEYSKCITVLRTSGLAKDRRFEVLNHKYKKLRTCYRTGGTEVENKSTHGSESSLDDIMTSTAHQEHCEQDSHHSIPCVGQCRKMFNRVEENEQYAYIKTLERQIDELREEIGASRSHNELLEFQVLEMEESNKGYKTCCACSAYINSDEIVSENTLNQMAPEHAKYEIKDTSLSISETLETSEDMGEKMFDKEEDDSLYIEKHNNTLTDEINSLNTIIARMTEDNKNLITKNADLQKTIENLTEQIRPIKTDLERRYEETKYKLSLVLKKVETYEKSKSEEDARNSDEMKELEEYNSQLEKQVAAQTEIIELLKSKLKEHKFMNVIKTRFEEGVESI